MEMCAACKKEINRISSWPISVAVRYSRRLDSCIWIRIQEKKYVNTWAVAWRGFKIAFPAGNLYLAASQKVFSDRFGWASGLNDTARCFIHTNSIRVLVGSADFCALELKIFSVFLHVNFLWRLWFLRFTFARLWVVDNLALSAIIVSSLREKNANQNK